MSSRATKHERYLLLLRLKAAGRSASQIAAETGYTRRHVLRLLADAKQRHADMVELRAA